METKSSPAKNRRELGRLTLIMVLVAIASVNAMSISVVLPSLPSIHAALSADITTVQLVLSGYLVAIAAGQLFTGPLADKMGRRPVLFGGFGVYILGSILAAAAPSIGVLIVARIIQGLGGSAGLVVSRSIIRDLFDRDRGASVLGYVTMGLAVAPMVAPAIGGGIDDILGWRAVFVFTTVAGALVAIAAWLVLPETGSAHRAPAKRSMLSDIKTLVGVPAFWAYALTAAFASSTYFAFLGGAPFIATEMLGLSASQLGALLLFVSVGYMVGNYLAGRISERVGIATMIQSGNTIVVTTVLGMMALYAFGWLNAWTLFLPVAFSSLGNGIALPSCISGSISVRPHLAGTASGLGGSLQFGVSAIAAVITGWALTVAPSAITLAAIMTAFALASLAAGRWSRVAAS